MIIIRKHPELVYSQKEYGFVTSKIVRPYKVTVGRIRRGLATKMEQGILKDIEKGSPKVSQGPKHELKRYKKKRK